MAQMLNARIVAYHYGATGFEAAPLLPVLFARDFVHVLFGTGEETLRQLAADNPNASLFKFGESDNLPGESPDLISALIPIRGLGALERDERRIAASALCVLARTAFMPLYRGDGLPAALSRVVAGGFRFAGFLNPFAQTTPSSRSQMGVLPTHGDAVFFRDVPGLKAIAHSEDDLYLKTLKLAFLSIAFGQVSYGLEALGQARNLAVSPPTLGLLGYRNYDRFLRDVGVAAEKSAVFLQDSSDRHGSEPPDEIIACLNRGHLVWRRILGAVELLRGGIPKLLWIPEVSATEVDPMAYWMLPFSARKGLGLLRRLWRAWKALTKGIPLSAAYKPRPDRSSVNPLESLLDAYGFWFVARESYTTRISMNRR